jgi:hypothetical protein
MPLDDATAGAALPPPPLPPPPVLQPPPPVPDDPSGTPAQRLLCERTLDVLLAAPLAPNDQLVGEAKREAAGRHRAQVVMSCVRFLALTAVPEEALTCGAAAMQGALDRQIDLGKLAELDEATAACGAKWKSVIGERAGEFQKLLREQRIAFGVAVFGFHRAYTFAGGRQEEFCRRFLAAAPGAPAAALLAVDAEIPAEWRAALDRCTTDAPDRALRPLLRWCLADRAALMLEAGTDRPCGPILLPGEAESFRAVFEQLRALTPPPPEGWTPTVTPSPAAAEPASPPPATP